MLSSGHSDLFLYLPSCPLTHLEGDIVKNISK
jgi:hypothetical protein